ncbi:hypothetical protein [Trinickia fusca]|uniref:Uncharacterized protein n=1 Tax=Trinickia fusca TaxID=2419777 RepID=A0A494X8P9_9BURK|nr:hypothetical protein [Trinickia fusca]RKP44544.1 hypothetical protein D7S89_21940 [Trinickia fusca]
MLATIKHEPRRAAWRVRQILFSAAIGVASVAYAGWAQAQTYRVVVDAGSSSSRALIYKIEGRTITLAGNPDSMPTGTELSGDVDGSAGVVKKLLGDVNLWLQRNVRVSPNDVTVDVLATAGMRKVNDSGNVYAAVLKQIQESPYNVGEARTISGAEEGLYAWIAVNDKEGRFAPHAKTRGIVEVGGASAQVAFEVERNADDVESVTIDGKPHKVYSRSFLGLGANDAWALAKDSQYGEKCKEGGGFDFAQCRKAYDTTVYDQTETGQNDAPVKLSLGVTKTALALQQALPVDDRDKFAGLGNAIKFSADVGFGKGSGGIDTACKSRTFSTKFHTCANAVFSESFVFGKLNFPNDKLQTGVDSSWTMGYLIKAVRQGAK